MRKQAASAQGETTLTSEVPGSKRPKWSGLNEEVQKSPTLINSNSLERAFDALPALEGAAQDTSREAYVSLEDGTPAGGPLSADKVMGEAPFIEIVVGSPPSARRSNLVIVAPVG